jgi:hypothetical protein
MVSQVEPIGNVDADNEQLLVDRARLGDRHAFDLLVIKYPIAAPAVYSQDWCPISLMPWDVLQDTFVKAFSVSLRVFRG